MRVLWHSGCKGKERAKAGQSACALSVPLAPTLQKQPTCQPDGQTRGGVGHARCKKQSSCQTGRGDTPREDPPRGRGEGYPSASAFILNV